MSLREWLILLGAVIVIGIILDGLRRMHQARKDSLEISRGMGADQLEDSPLDDYNPELPSGGARIVGRPDDDDARAEPHPGQRPIEEEAGELGLSARELDDQLPEDFSLHADTRDGAGEEEFPPETRANSAAAAGEAPTDSEPASPARTVRRPVQKPRPRPTPRRGLRPVASPADGEQQPREKEKVSPEPAAAASAPSRPARPPAGANRPPAKEVFVINVHSRDDEGFPGSELKRLFEACGLEHGDMDIYHRHENDDTHTPVQFSVANAVHPGTFKPAEMADLRTPAISFFMSLPGPSDSLQAYDFMIETAQVVVRHLGGELKDERRSVVTAQTIEHGRQRVREFERKRRSAKV